MKHNLNPDRPISMQDIADELGISKGSVSLALSDSKKISEDTKIKVRKLAMELGYKRNALVGYLQEVCRVLPCSG